MKHLFFIKENIENKHVVAFNKATMDFFIVNPDVEVIVDYIELHGIEEAVKEFKLTIDDTLGFSEMLKLHSLDNQIVPQSDLCTPVKKSLDRLVLGVTNVCNMKCTYCYADGGNYHSSESLMSEETALMTIDRFFHFFDEINSIQFFGGEPLMNVDLIEICCEYIKEKVEGKVIDSMPRLGIVTNGTLIDERVINLVEKYEINVTVSIDGDQLIHDSNRIDNAGNGTYKSIIENADRLYKRTNEPSTFEVTYNKKHTDFNVSIKDIVLHLGALFPKTFVHIAPVSTPVDELALVNRTAFIESVDDVFMSLKSDKPFNYSLSQRLIDALKNKKSSDYICNAGLGTISVDAKGDIYPCFMFTDIEALKLGSVYAKDFITNQKAVILRKDMLDLHKKNDPKCRECLLEYFCSGCHGMNYFTNGQLGNYEQEFCTMNIQMAEKVILNLSNCYQETQMEA